MIAELLANGARILCGCRARWLAEPPEPGPRIYFANHTSHLDALIIWSALPPACRQRCQIVAAADYWQATLLRRWLSTRVLPTVLVERKHVTRENNPLNDMLAALDADNALILFPEGTRGAGAGPGEFRAGLWHLARHRSDLTFVPVWLENLSRVLPKGEFLPVPIMTAVTFGSPLQRLPDQQKDDFLHMLHNRLVQLRETHT
jgi:1-acyl-sn-glycerol-3-phosphate acyltransferase